MCITLTEPHGGSDLANVLTTAEKTPDGRHYIVNGQKKFITGGLNSDFFSTLVRTGGKSHGGISLLVIPKGPGVKVIKMKAQGWWAGNTTLVDFEECKVPVENLIGEENSGFKMMAAVDTRPASESIRVGVREFTSVVNCHTYERSGIARWLAEQSWRTTSCSRTTSSSR